MNKKEIFKMYHSRTKEAIVEEFKSHYKYYKENDDFELQSKEQKEKYLKLCDKFLKALEKLHLPQLTDEGWFYAYITKNDSIDLSLSYCDEFEVEDDEITEETFSDEYVLLSVKCEYLTVAEYAELYHVAETTVRQWIRRGKLRSAKKQGRDWIIPDIAGRPTRGYETAIYFWKELPSELIKMFPFLEGYNQMFIFQNKEDKGLFDVVLEDYFTHTRERVQVSNTKREKLELELISSGAVDVEEWKIFHT